MSAYREQRDGPEMLQPNGVVYQADTGTAPVAGFGEVCWGTYLAVDPSKGEILKAGFVPEHPLPRFKTQPCDESFQRTRQHRTRTH